MTVQSISRGCGYDHQRERTSWCKFWAVRNDFRLPNLPKEKLLQAEKEFKILKSGNQGEQNSAYFIDFYYKDSQNWAIIHDLRIEHDGLTAQIDHLLLNRCLDFYVLETKHYARGIKITEYGEFLVEYQNNYVAIESPIEQNKRPDFSR